MRSAMIVGLMIWAGAAGAAESPTKAMLLGVNKALALARQDSEACRGGALGGLKDARDAIETTRGNPTVEALTKARRALEDLLDAGGAGCGPATRDAMQEAAAAIKAGLDALANAPPSGVDKVKAEKRQCWNYRNDWSAVDPACHAPRDGHYPLPKAEIEAILAKIQGADDGFARVEVVNRDLAYEKKRYLSAAQLAAILARLETDIDRLEAVKTTARHLVDPKASGVAVQPIRDPAVRRDALQTIQEANE